MTGNDSPETGDYRDGQLVLAARCTECDWELGTDEPSTWSLVEQFRHEHEDETGHRTTVETITQRTILATRGAKWDLGDALLDMADDELLWICPECERSGEELNSAKKCPDCDEPLREVLP